MPQTFAELLQQLLSGPTAYEAMTRDNLAMDHQWGGKKPTSGMTQFNPSFTGSKRLGIPNFRPRIARDDPIIPIIPNAPPVVTPTTPTTPTTPIVPKTDPNTAIIAGLSKSQGMGGKGRPVVTGYRPDGTAVRSYRAGERAGRSGR